MKYERILLLATLTTVLATHIAIPQTPGTVKSFQKIINLDPNEDERVSDFFGISIDSMGDLDEDGISDIVVGALEDDGDGGGTDRGAIWVLFLNANGTVREHEKINDQVGGFSEILADGDRFGASVASIGDLDGDGVVDLAVGAFNDNNAKGAVWVLFLNKDGSVKTQKKIDGLVGELTGELESDRFGVALAHLGDLDGDGVSDIAVGADQDSDGGSNSGAVYILYLHQDGTVKGNKKISSGNGIPQDGLISNGNFGAAVSSLGDLDRDGTMDLVIGQPQGNDGGVDKGAVWILFLNSDGTVKRFQKISATEGNFSGTLLNGDRFGEDVDTIGDINGDGTPDIAVGAFLDDDGGNDKGAVWILFLNSDGTVKGHQKISENLESLEITFNSEARFGISVSSLGDLNEDGIADLVVGIEQDNEGGMNSGAALILNLNGAPQASVGNFVWHDVNENGVQDDGEPGLDNIEVRLFQVGADDAIGGGDDFLVSRQLSTNGGHYEFLNMNSGSYFIEIDVPNNTTISPKDAGGDDGLDSDINPLTGRTDAFTLAVGENNSTVDAGIILGTGAVKSFQKISEIEGNFSGVLDDHDVFGASVTTIGDFDGDGTNDVAVGAVEDDDGGENRGAVWILLLEPDGSVKDQQKISSTSGGFTGTLEDGDFFGASVTPIGDFDGDGTTDIAVGARQDDDGGTDRGAVWILLLAPDGSVKDQQKISSASGGFTGALQNEDFFGRSMTQLGDLNGDGTLDLAVGAYRDDDGGTDRGAVWILFLEPDGSVKDQQKISSISGGFTGALQNEDFFGASISPIGDFNGDGTVDIAVGAIQDDDGGTDRGAVWILFLEPDGSVKDQQKISSTSGGFAGVLDDNEFFGASLTQLGDLNGDGTLDLAVGAYRDDDGGTNRGAVWILLLKPDGSVNDQQKISDTQGNFSGPLNNSDLFGRSLTEIGDLDEDGITDLAVGTVWDDDGGTNRGAVWILNLNGTPQAAVGDFVWNDVNENGLQDEGEPGIRGVEVRLFQVGADSGIGGGDDFLVARLVSGEDGRYEFKNVNTGDYYLEFEIAKGMVISGTNQGGDDALDSDVKPVSDDGEVPITGRTEVFTLDVDEENASIDAGFSFDLEVTQPNGGESWVIGTRREIKWTPAIIPVKIEISSDGGSNWEEISEDTGPNRGVFAWEVNGQESSDYSIRMTDVATGQKMDTSDNSFEIIAGPSNVWYVNLDASGKNNGTSWEDAFNDIQDALIDAREGDEVWVAEGTYKPTDTGDRTISFVIKNGVKLYGGFEGTERSRSEREISSAGADTYFVHETILSGDLNGDDGPDFENNEENTFHIVRTIDDSEPAALDGVTVSNGNANGGGRYSQGCGVYIDLTSSVTISNCLIRKNWARSSGAGIFAENVDGSSHATILNCIIQNNSAHDGAGVQIDANAEVILDGCKVTANTAKRYGGGIYIRESVEGIIRNSYILQNSAMEGGGLYIDNRESAENSRPSIIKNCVISDNSATTSGEAISIIGIVTSSQFTNCTITTNSEDEGGTVVVKNSDPKISNCILWNGTTNQETLILRDEQSSPTFTHSLIQNSGGSTAWLPALGIDGGGNIDSVPLFINFADPDGADDVFATIDDGLRLLSASPCINSGIAEGAPENDIVGVGRPPEDGVDMGAYENDISITIHTPAGGESWVVGTTRTIQWTAPLNVRRVNIKLVCENQKSGTLGESLTAETGLFAWQIAGGFSDNCRIQIIDVNNNSNVAESLQFETMDISGQTRIFVNDDASGLNNGSSWPNAFTSLQDALAVATARDEIWVAEGRYTPGDISRDRTKSFALKDDVSIFGGFELGTAEKSQRILGENPTILTGDLNQNDNPEDAATFSDNSFHVLTCDSSVSSVFLDRIVISNGNASGNSPHHSGGGLFNDGGTVALNHCIFSSNRARVEGGGIYCINGGNISLKNSIIHQNEAGLRGAGIYYENSVINIVNSVFTGNTTDNVGGGIYNLGSNSIITNCTFSFNSADQGAGMYNNASSPLVNNSIFWGNISRRPRPISEINIFDEGASDTQLSKCLVQGGFKNEVAVIDQNPFFLDAEDPDGADNIFLTSDDGFQLDSQSPGIDAAGASAPGFSQSDVLGNQRVDDKEIENTGAAEEPFPDLGAYERQVDSDPSELMQAATIVIDEPKESRIIFGHTIPISALAVRTTSLKPIVENVWSNIRFIPPLGEPIDQGDIAENGLITLSDNFAPDKIGLWTLEITWFGTQEFDEVTVSKTIDVGPAATSIAVNRPSRHLKNTPLEITGLFSLAEGNPGRLPLEGVQIDFELFAPGEEASRAISPTFTQANSGRSSARYTKVIGATEIDKEGMWKLKVSSQGNHESLLPSPMQEVEIKVVPKLGYAIIVQGSIPALPGKDPEGVEDHARTIKFVKDAFKEGGINDTSEANDPEDPTDDVFEIPPGQPKSELKKAITTWAKAKMSSVPAPLYMTLINHGEIDKFHMNANLPEVNDNILTPDDLDGWLMELEGSLEITQDITIVLGMCFSGSFIDTLSKPDGRRIIVSASAANERSIRGPGGPDSRHGEFFVYLLYRELRTGASLLESFRVSQRAVLQMSSQFDLLNNSGLGDADNQNIFGLDTTGQNAMLDDDGDGVGSIVIPSQPQAEEDGAKAKNVFLVPPTNSIDTLAVTKVHPTLFLRADDSAQNKLWAEADNPEGPVTEIFLEVKLPTPGDPDKEDADIPDSMQAGLAMEGQLMVRNDEVADKIRFEWPPFDTPAPGAFDPILFDAPGLYQIFYYARSESGSGPSEPAVSFLYRAPDTPSPSSFSLIYPVKGATIDFDIERDDPENALGVFDWEESKSPNPPVQYLLRLWKDNQRAELGFESGLLDASFVFLTQDELPFGTFFWDVVAVDSLANFTISELREVKVAVTNFGEVCERLGCLGVSVKDAESNAPLSNGSVTVQPENRIRESTFSQGNFLAFMQPSASEPVIISVEFSGYEKPELREVLVNQSNPVEELFLLSKEIESSDQWTFNVLAVGPSVVTMKGAHGRRTGNSEYPIHVDNGFQVDLEAPEAVVINDIGYRFTRWEANGFPDNLEPENPKFPSFLITQDTDLTAVYNEIGLQFILGWNLVSTPVELENNDLVNVLGANGLMRPAIWEWSRGRFRRPTEIGPGQAFWVRSDSDQSVLTRGSPSQQLTRGVLQKGWNLVGINGFHPINAPADFAIVGSIWGWDPAKQTYFSINDNSLPEYRQGKLFPAQGYWIYALNDEVVTLGANVEAL